MRLRKAPKAPIAVAGILATPLFFVALMAMTVAVEKPTVAHVVRHGNAVTRLGEPSGATERAIWLLAIVPPVALVLIGVGAMLIGRAGVIVSAVAAIGATVALLVPLDTWTHRHTARYPDGIDLIRRGSTSDIYLRGEWEGTARHTAEQLGAATITLGALAIAVFALLEVRRRRHGSAPAPPPPPPEVATSSATPGRM
jgi:hypothetical protein